jgi:hypothetical protein
MASNLSGSDGATIFFYSADFIASFFRCRARRIGYVDFAMTAPFRNPALAWLVQQFGNELLVGQVLVRRQGPGFELRHVDDRDAAVDDLTIEKPEAARGLSQFTADGAFRPLKSAPTLRRGWRIEAASDADLEIALNRLYPGFIPDLYAVRTRAPHVTGYREFTNRQTGMYRITTFLNDADAGAMIAKCCSARFCLKQRLWSVEGLAPDRPETKSLIPCLEPCAVLLEYARKVVRASQWENVPAAEAVERIEPDVKAE